MLNETFITCPQNFEKNYIDINFQNLFLDLKMCKIISLPKHSHMSQNLRAVPGFRGQASWGSEIYPPLYMVVFYLWEVLCENLLFDL